MRKLFKSLQAKYMLIICVALVLFQTVYIGTAIVFTSFEMRSQDETPDYTEVEAAWHAAAKELDGDIEQAVEQLFASWSKQYPNAAMFWVNDNGDLQSSWNVKRELPSSWSAAYTAQYIKDSYGNDPFTVIAFVAEQKRDGFVVIELPRKLFNSPMNNLYEKYGNLVIVTIIVILIFFVFISYLFFRNIRKRLLSLQEAMSIRDVDMLPIEITVSKQDEIGQLEQAFNQMVTELKQSRAREKEDEQVRRQLIANLSHDIRTPLTKIRANAYTLSKQELPIEAASSAAALEGSIRQLDELVDNLLAYTLLIGERYKMELTEVAMPRFLREQAAAWYAVFEQQGFDFEIKLDDMKHSNWRVDRSWMKRIIDNLLQNVLRHAAQGKYVAVETVCCDGYDAIRIIDRGLGMSDIENSSGSGIGLSIVDMMIKGMGLTWTTEQKHPYFIVEIRKPHF